MGFRMLRKRIRRAIRHLIILVLVTLVAVFSVVWTVSRLDRPEYSALVIALMGIFFSIWWDDYKENRNGRRAKLALLSQISVELNQNKNAINSVLGTEKDDARNSNPAPLRTNAWLAASASPYFTWIDAKMVHDLISVYGRLDLANYLADIFKTTKHSPRSTYEGNDMSEWSRDLYLTIIRVVSDQIDQALSGISSEIEELK